MTATVGPARRSGMPSPATSAPQPGRPSAIACCACHHRNGQKLAVPCFACCPMPGLPAGRRQKWWLTTPVVRLNALRLVSPIMIRGTWALESAALLRRQNKQKPGRNIICLRHVTLCCPFTSPGRRRQGCWWSFASPLWRFAPARWYFAPTIRNICSMFALTPHGTWWRVQRGGIPACKRTHGRTHPTSIS